MNLLIYHIDVLNKIPFRFITCEIPTNYTIMVQNQKYYNSNIKI